MFPIIPLVALIGLIGGAFTLNWYYNLPSEERKKADLKANELAFEWYKKKLDELTGSQAKQVLAETKRHFDS